MSEKSESSGAVNAKTSREYPVFDVNFLYITPGRSTRLENDEIGTKGMNRGNPRRVFQQNFCLFVHLSRPSTPRTGFHYCDMSLFLYKHSLQNSPTQPTNNYYY